jgi:hypothetical protein
MSHEIPSGEVWFDVVLKELASADYCVACLTPENFRSPWVLFEAGAIANRPEGKGKSFTCAYLIDLTSKDLEGHPLSSFQSARASKAGTLALVRSINKAREKDKLDQGRLDKAFDKWWDELAEVLEGLPMLDFRSYPEVFFTISPKSDLELCLEVARSQTRNGAVVQVGKYTGRLSQQWKLQETEGEFCSILARHSNKCLDVENFKKEPHANVYQWEYTGGDNQQWSLTPTADKFLLIAARHSGLYLDCTPEGAIQVESGSQPPAWSIRPAR